MPLPYIAQAIEEIYITGFGSNLLPLLSKKITSSKCIITAHMMLNVSKSFYKSMQNQITKVTYQDVQCNFKVRNEI